MNQKKLAKHLLIKLALFFLVTIIPLQVFAKNSTKLKSQEAPFTLNSLFIKQSVKQSSLGDTAASYIFSGAQASSINYMQYCYSADNTCSSCIAPVLSTSLVGSLPYTESGTHYVFNTSSMTNLLHKSGLSYPGIYYIKLYVQSSGINDCSSGYCSASQDSELSNPHALCLTAQYDGTNVAAITQNDNGHVNLNTPALQYSYITEIGQTSNVLKCSIDGGGLFPDCSPTPSTYGFPTGISISTVNGVQYAYIANQGDSPNVSKCEIDNTDGGRLINCIDAGTYGTSATPWSSIFDIELTTVESTQYAYVVNYDVNDPTASVIRCGLNTNDVFENTGNGACISVSNFPISLGFPVGIAFTTVESIQYAYVTDNGTDSVPGAVYKCKLNNDGTFSPCSATATAMESIGWTPHGIQVAYANNGIKYAYIVDHSMTSPAVGKIYKCSIDTNGELSNCISTPTTGSVFDSWKPTVIRFFTSNGTSHAYAEEYSNSKLYICDLDASGSFVSCVDDTSQGFMSPVTDIAFAFIRP